MKGKTGEEKEDVPKRETVLEAPSIHVSTSCKYDLNGK